MRSPDQGRRNVNFIKNNTAALDQTIWLQRGGDLIEDRMSNGHPASEPFTAEAQTSLWIKLATLARPSSGFFQVKASGIEAFFLAMNSFRDSSIAGSR